MGSFNRTIHYTNDGIALVEADDYVAMLLQLGVGVHDVTSGDDLRAVLGYWDDSAGVRVPGIAVAGNIVRLSFVGTYDLGATDNILYPEAGVGIIGPGSDLLTIQGRLFILSTTGGTSVVSRLEGFTLDVDGDGPMPTGIRYPAVSFGTIEFVDVSLACRDLKITNATPAAGDLNLVTIITHDDTGISPIEAVFLDCVFSGAERDAFSTKGDGFAQTTSTVKLFNCTIGPPGSGAADQAVTSHEGIGIWVYGGTITAGSGGIAAQPDNVNTPLHIYNATISGRVWNVQTLSGCVIDALDAAKCIEITGAATFNFSHTKVTNWGSTTAKVGIYSATDADINLDHVWFDSLGSGTAVFCGSTETLTCANVVCNDTYRGVDARVSTGHSLTDSVLEASQYSLLENATLNFTLSNNKASVASLQGFLSATAGFSQADIDAATATVKTLVQTQPGGISTLRTLIELGSYSGLTMASVFDDKTPQAGGDFDMNGHTMHFGTAENVQTPTGTTATIDLGAENHHTLNCGSATDAITLTLTVPPGPCGGTIIVIQDDAAKDITWSPSAGSVVWLGTEPTWSSDTNKTRIVSWRWNATNLYLSATDTN